VAANRSAGCAAEFVNIGRNVVVALKSGLVETRLTVLVATALPISDQIIALLCSIFPHLRLGKIPTHPMLLYCNSLNRKVSYSLLSIVIHYIRMNMNV